jgi:hypothetical protein
MPTGGLDHDGDGHLPRGEGCDDGLRPQPQWRRARSDRTVDELLDEWDQVEEALANSEAIVLVADLTVHFDDIRETVEGPVARVGVDIPHTLGRYHHFQASRFRAMDAPSVDLACVDTGERFGDGGSAVVRGDSYDLVRCLVGRRSRAEADEVLDWGDTTDETKRHFPIYGWNNGHQGVHRAGEPSAHLGGSQPPVVA